MSRIRHPAVAGSFYPGDRAELSGMVDRFLREAPSFSYRPPAIISPHAGYIYSGPIAATAFSPFLSGRGEIETVMILSPSHQIPFEGLALCDFDAYSTPLGDLPVATKIQSRLLELPGVSLWNEVHLPEHSLEVQLPFIQRTLGDVSILPVVVGSVTAERSEALLDLFLEELGEEKSLIVISSDLSHYHNYAAARSLDRTTANAICNLEWESIHGGDACGRHPIQGLLALAGKRGWKALEVDLRNSGDTAGPRDQVVGYGAFHFVKEAVHALH